MVCEHVCRTRACIMRLLCMTDNNLPQVLPLGNRRKFLRFFNGLGPGQYRCTAEADLFKGGALHDVQRASHSCFIMLCMVLTWRQHVC